MHKGAAIILVRCRSASDQAYPFKFHFLFVAYGMIVFPQPLFMYSTNGANEKNDRRPSSRYYTVCLDKMNGLHERHYAYNGVG